MKKEQKFINSCVRIDLGGQIFCTVITYLSYLLLVKLLKVHTYGLFVLVSSMLTFFITFSMFGMQRSIVKFISQLIAKQKEDGIPALIKDSFFIVLSLGFVIFCFTLLWGKNLVITYFKKYEIWQFFFYFIMFFPFFIVMNLNFAILQGLKRIREKVIFEKILLPSIKFSLFIVIFLLNLNLKEVVKATIVSVVLVCIITSLFLLKKFWHRRDRWNKVSIFKKKEIARFSYPLFMDDLLNFILYYADVMLIGCFLSFADVSIYNIAAKISLVCSFILYSYGAIFAPLMGEFFHANDRVGMKRLFKFSSEKVFSISLPTFFIIVLFGRDILQMFGQSFTVGYYPLVLLSLCQLINASVGCVGYTLIMTGRSKLVFLNTLSSALSNIVLNLILIPPFGILGAAIATGFSIALLNLLGLSEVYLLYKLHPFSFGYFCVFISGLIAFSIVKAISEICIVSNPYFLLIMSILFIFCFIIFNKLFNSISTSLRK